jgi:hypothetical protein
LIPDVNPQRSGLPPSELSRGSIVERAQQATLPVSARLLSQAPIAHRP